MPPFRFVTLRMFLLFVSWTEVHHSFPTEWLLLTDPLLVSISSFASCSSSWGESVKAIFLSSSLPSHECMKLVLFSKNCWQCWCKLSLLATNLCHFLLMRFYHLWIRSKALMKFWHWSFGSAGQLTVIIGIVDTLQPFHKEAVHRTVEQVLGSTPCLDHNGENHRFYVNFVL